MTESTSISERKLDQTPTWAVAGICASIVIISILLEKVLHKIGQWFNEKHKRALFEALEKVKSELMVMGFISLIFTFSQSYAAKICIPAKLADTMLPCKADGKSDTSSSTHRRLLSSTSGPQCKEGYEPLISSDGLHQLHILIFFLAVFHVLYSAVTMMLGKMKIRAWKVWEHETSSLDYEFSNDPSRFRLTHETSFVKAHASFWTRVPIFFYVVRGNTAVYLNIIVREQQFLMLGCFFRQFFRSVTKPDFLTLRNGFITTHISPRGRFDFQKYIMRSLEDDFKVVVGVSPLLWASFVVFLLLNVNGMTIYFFFHLSIHVSNLQKLIKSPFLVSGWHTMLWASIIPLIIILAVGTKLQAILTCMALEITERHAVVQGIPLVQGSDGYFWFSRPRFVLHLLHFTLFQNAFQITYFLWIWYEFGINSCFHDSLPLAITKISIGVFAVLLCSYITLPLYALVTQMGSHMKKSVFDEHTSKALKKWQLTVKKKQGDSCRPSSTMTLTLGEGGRGASASSTLHSSMRSLRRFKTTGHSSYREDDEFSNPETNGGGGSMSSQTASGLIVRVDHGNREAEMTTTHKEDELPLHSHSIN
ncbi:hypothetical protein V2J09_016688 [Rumex salicifolius]